jgi:hypothetical protein
MDRACKETSGGMASVLGGDRAVIEEVCKACDIDVANYYDNEAIHTLIYNSRILSEKQYPNPNEKAPLPNCKERR